MDFNNTQFAVRTLLVKEKEKSTEFEYFKRNSTPVRSLSENCVMFNENELSDEASPYYLLNKPCTQHSSKTKKNNDLFVQNVLSLETSFQDVKHLSESVLEIPKLKKKVFEFILLNGETFGKEKDNHINSRPKETKFPSFHSLDEISQTLITKEQQLYSNQVESFVSIKSCRQDQASGVDETIMFSRDPRTQNMLVSRANIENDSPPPLYSVNDMSNSNYQGYRYNSRPAYQYGTTAPGDASRAPPYQLNDPMITLNLFDDILIRRQFVRKVYAILGLQLLVTFGLIAVTTFHKPTKLFFIRNYFLLYIVSTIAFFVMFIVLSCSQSARRIVPLNFLLLTLFTIAMAILAATLSSIYSTYIVMLTFGVTAVICLSVTIIAFLPCFDITGYYIYLFIAGLILLFYGLIAIVISLLTKSNIFYIIYAALATILFSIYLIFDTQKLLAGKRVQLSPEEYILGAISLYVDIIYIFLFLLTLCGNR